MNKVVKFLKGLLICLAIAILTPIVVALLFAFGAFMMVALPLLGYALAGIVVIALIIGVIASIFFD